MKPINLISKITRQTKLFMDGASLRQKYFFMSTSSRQKNELEYEYEYYNSGLRQQNLLSQRKNNYTKFYIFHGLPNWLGDLHMCM